MSNIYNVWKGKEKLTSKSFSPMIGMVYKSNKIVGVLIEIEEDTSVLQTRVKNKVKVKTTTLKIIIDDQHCKDN